MNFLAAADGTSLEDRISKRFGHAAFHLVVNGENPEILKAQAHEHDLPSHGLDRFSAGEFGGVIAGNVGPGAFDDLTARNLPFYIVRNVTVGEAVEKVVRGEVKAATEPSMKHSAHSHDHHHGDGDGHGGGH